MKDIEILKDKLKIKEKELDDYVLDINNDYLSEEAENIRKEIYDLQNEISKREKNYNSVTEDLKILEELVDIYYDCAGNKEQDYDMRVDIGFMKKETQALENLIKGYRELERKFKIKTGDVEYLENKINKHFIDDVTLQRDFIPKSKIKEKIEELKGYRDTAREMIEHRVVIADSDSLNYGRAEAHDKDIEVLQELMEEK